MPARPEGVYADSRGQWYFKVTLGKDALTGRWEQITRHGYPTASEAAKARRGTREARRGRAQRRSILLLGRSPTSPFSPSGALA